MYGFPLSAVVDVETTGVDPARDRVVEVAVILTDFREVYHVLSTLINPTWDFGHNEANGISYSDVLSSPTFASVAPLVHMCLLLADEFVAYQAAFDQRFLQAELAAVGLRLPRRAVYDPFRASRCSLAEACAKHGVYVADVSWHSALGDATATFRLAKLLRSREAQGEAPQGAVTLGPRFS